MCFFPVLSRRGSFRGIKIQRTVLIMLQLREPLRELLKDEVRALGRRLQIHEDDGRGQRVNLDTFENL